MLLLDNCRIHSALPEIIAAVYGIGARCEWLMRVADAVRSSAHANRDADLYREHITDMQSVMHVSCLMLVTII